MAKTFKTPSVVKMLDWNFNAVRLAVEEASIEVDNSGKSRAFPVSSLFDLAHFKARVRPRGRNEIASGTKVITVYAPKGGVGKTTLTANLATQFALIGVRVLCVDADFQANLTTAFGYDSELTDEMIEEELFDEKDKASAREKMVEFHLGHLFKEWPGAGKVTLGDVIKKPFGEHGPHILPADLTLDQLDTLLAFQALSGQDANRTFARMVVDGKKGEGNFDISKYEVVLIDAAPAKNRITRGALFASDFVVSPCSMERFSTKGLSYLSGMLQEMQETAGRCPDLLIAGNFFDASRIRTAKQLAAITKFYSRNWIEATVRASEEFRRVLDEDDGTPLLLSRPSCDAAGELRLLANEILKRTGVISA